MVSQCATSRHELVLGQQLRRRDGGGHRRWFTLATNETEVSLHQRPFYQVEVAGSNAVSKRGSYDAFRHRRPHGGPGEQ